MKAKNIGSVPKKSKHDSLFDQSENTTTDDRAPKEKKGPEYPEQ